jgi:hypothetical protein
MKQQPCQLRHVAQLMPHMGGPAPGSLDLEVKATQLQQLCAHAVERQRRECYGQGLTLHSHVQGVKLGQPEQRRTCSSKQIPATSQLPDKDDLRRVMLCLLLVTDCSPREYCQQV